MIAANNVRIGDLVRVRNGGTPNKSRPEFWQGDIPWISPKDFDKSGLRAVQDFITSDAIAGSAASIVSPGTVLAVVRSGVLAHTFPVAILDASASFNQDVKAFIPDTSRLAPRFLYHLLRSLEPIVIRQGVKRGATVHSLQSGFVEDMRIALPPLAEQRRIVEILDRAAAIQRLRRAAEEKAREIIPALFVDMFGDPATNPKGWPILKLEKVAEIQGGIQVSAKRSTLPVELPYLRVANVFRSRLDLSEIKTIRLTAAEALRARLMQGDIMVVEGHGNPKELGRAAIWDGSIKDCTHQNHLIRVRPNRQRILPDYVEALLNSEAGRKFLVGRGKTTSGLNTISTRNVRDVSMAIPPFAMQQEFARRANSLRAISLLHNNATADSQNISTALASLLLE